MRPKKNKNVTNEIRISILSPVKTYIYVITVFFKHRIYFDI